MVRSNQDGHQPLNTLHSFPFLSLHCLRLTWDALSSQILQAPPHCCRAPQPQATSSDSTFIIKLPQPWVHSANSAHYLAFITCISSRDLHALLIVLEFLLPWLLNWNFLKDRHVCAPLQPAVPDVQLVLSNASQQMPSPGPWHLLSVRCTSSLTLNTGVYILPL